MIWNIFYISALIISGSITTAMGFHLWINRKVLNPSFFLIMVAAIWIWIITQIGEGLFKDISIKRTFHFIQYFGIGFLASAWFSFSIEFVDLKIKPVINKAIFFILSGLPALVLGGLMISGNSTLFWKSTVLSPNNILLLDEYGPLYFIFTVFIFCILAGGIVILLHSSLKKGLIELRRQALLILSVLAPLGVYFIDAIWHEELFFYDLTPIILSLSSLAVIYFTRLRYFRTIPLTQHVVIESMNDNVIILGPDDRIIYVNRAGSLSLKNMDISFIGKPIETLSPDLATLLKKAGDEQSFSEEIELNGKVFDVNISPIRNWTNTLISRVLVLRDISKLKTVEQTLREMKLELEVRVHERTRELKEANTALIDEIVERTKAENIIKSSLEEKNILLGELHHRVKNNLQIISSLLNLQSHYLTDKKAKDAFNLSIARIRSIALIHEKLYKSEDLSHTNFPEYIHELTYYILSSQSEPGENINLVLNVEKVLLSINRSILCGLIINELFTNALKHAFPKNKQGTANEEKQIVISFVKQDEMYILTIRDNGTGIPQNYLEGKESSLGLKIIHTLVRQLKGSVEFSHDSGTSVSILFPLEEP
ncbi:MAG: hypothetical protein JW904_14340 [Spirochaetales bacterium]|nr:hypothetical protein [Spirochaetales bacterium]